MYLVKCEGGGHATHEHPTWESATAEAHRLSTLHPGKKFHVLRSAGYYEVQQPQPVFTKTNYYAQN